MTMDIFAVGVCALCVVLFGGLIKRSNGEYAFLAAIAACVLIGLAVLEQLKPVISQIQSISQSNAFSEDILLILLKAVGIAVIGQLVSQLCKDAGESALSYAVGLFSRAAILTAALPLFTRIFTYLEEIVRL